MDFLDDRTDGSHDAVARIATAIDEADAVLIGAGAGLSAAAGFTYTGPRFERNLADFRERFGIRDMYSGGFYPFPDEETRWAWWSRQIMLNRYDVEPGRPYLDLLSMMGGKDYFVLTTNVDHQFQLAGFDKGRLFYTQGDYGLFQCSRPCRQETFDNEERVRAMVAAQRDMRVPTELLPRCPHCGAPLTMNLRIDDTFVEDAGWMAASARYRDFLQAHEGTRMVLLELGVGSNTPGIIKYPFWRLASRNPLARYICINLDDAYVPGDIAGQSIGIEDDVAKVLDEIRSYARRAARG